MKWVDALLSNIPARVFHFSFYFLSSHRALTWTAEISASHTALTLNQILRSFCWLLTPAMWHDNAVQVLLYSSLYLLKKIVQETTRRRFVNPFKTVLCFWKMADFQHGQAWKLLFFFQVLKVWHEWFEESWKLCVLFFRMNK